MTLDFFRSFHDFTTINLQRLKTLMLAHVARRNHETLKIQNFAKHFDFWVNLGH